MLPELGLLSLIFALCFALLQSILPLLTLRKPEHSLKRILTHCTFNMAFGQCLFLLIGFIILMVSFIQYDFSVFYVFKNSNADLPFWYRVAGTWSGHEGSLLLWCLILSLWGSAVIYLQKGLSKDTLLRITCVLGFLSTGFILFLITTSNPFSRIFPDVLLKPQDLTPILQDPGLIFHPPALYLGYVGFAVAFAFAITALWQKKMDLPWIQNFRRWIVLSWCFLTIGITLGSWWAYRELGWGGWWFWDPVENASFTPWLAGAALIHSLLVNEKRDAFKSWTILLALISFALTLLGTFIVRSGVLISVHAFASDPSRGILLLLYLAVVCLAGFGFYFKNSQFLTSEHDFSVFSRETFLLLNNVILMTAVAAVVLGTLYPIFFEALGLGKISVGEPYYNIVFVPIMLPLLLFMAIAPYCSWHQETLKGLIRKVNLWFIISLILSVLISLWLTPWHFMVFLGLFIGLFIILTTASKGISYLQRTKNISPNYFAMIFAHIGIAIVVLGITVNRYYSLEKQIRLAPNQTATIKQYQITLLNNYQTASANFKSEGASFAIQKHGKLLGTLKTEQREFYSNNMVVTKTGIMANPMRDIYIALGEQFTDKSWAVRIYYEPLVRWLWFGGALVALGGIMTFFKRKRGKK